MGAQSGERLIGDGASSSLELAVIFGGRGGFDESFFDEELIHLDDGGLEELWIHVEVKKAMTASFVWNESAVVAPEPASHFFGKGAGGFEGQNAIGRAVHQQHGGEFAAHPPQRAGLPGGLT